MAATRKGGVRSHPHPNSHTTNPSAPLCATGKVFQAAQAHWLTVCLHVMLDLHVADVLCKGAAGGDQAPTGADSTNGPQQQQGMHIDQVRVLQLTAGRPSASQHPRGALMIACPLPLSLQCARAALHTDRTGMWCVRAPSVQGAACVGAPRVA